MTRRNYIFLAILLFISFQIKAQQIPKLKIKELLVMIDTSTVPLVVNFWASWCKPCVQEIPWFETSVKAMADKKIKLVLVSVDFGEDYPKKLQSFVKMKGYTSKVVWLNETNADYFCPLIDKNWSGTIPVTLMVNNAKKYRAFYGEQIPEPRLPLELQKLVE